jgi:predicted cupin superfamily sugar epimerase
MHGGSWHGSRVLPGGEYTFVGTSMSPGFVEGGYEHADRDELIRLYPDRKEMIEALTGEVKYF